MKYSIIIATRDRAHHLRGTLASLATIKTTDDWELIVVDNNSVDDTPGVVREMAHGYPAPIRYVYEAVPGRSAALNTGISAARGQIIATTDDDVRVPQDWLDVAGAAFAPARRGYMQSPERARHDFTNVPRVCDVPRDLCRTAARHAAAMVASCVRADACAAFEHELWLCMFAGIVRQRWRDRQQPFEWHSAPRVTAT